MGASEPPPPDRSDIGRSTGSPTWKKGCCSACAAVGRLAGSHLISSFMRSMASGEAEGISWESGVATNCGNLKFMFCASASPCFHELAVGVPSTDVIL